MLDNGRLLCIMNMIYSAMVSLSESAIGLCTSKNILKYIISTRERVLYLIFQYDKKILKHNICIQFTLARVIVYKQ